MISVILPVHNGEAFIADAVASVLGQSWSDLELIVVDDGSTDATRKILSTITDKRLQVQSRPQSGPAASRNQGIHHAQGEFIAFIDADDVWLPAKLETQLAAFERMPAATVAYCWTDYMDAEGNFVCPDSRPRFEGDVYEQLLIRNFIDCCSNVMVRRQALLDSGGFDESLPVIEDWDLNTRLAANHPFVCTPQALVGYRQSPETLSTRVLLMEETYCRFVDQAFARAPAPLQKHKSRAVAHFYEYLLGKVTQGVPTREKGQEGLRFFATAIRNRPSGLLELWRRPWVIKAVAKALLAIVLPASVTQRIAGRMSEQMKARARTVQSPAGRDL